MKESADTQVNETLVVKYLDGLVNKVFKLLPMREENNETLDDYRESLILELIGYSDTFAEYRITEDFVALLSNLQSLGHVEEFSVYRRKVLQCVNLTKKLK